MKIDVLGLGESLEYFKPSGGITIGVNDIWSRHKTDYVVCVDVPNVFSKERLEVIKSTNCKGFYSHIREWDNMPNFKFMRIEGGRGKTHFIDTDIFCHSNSSPYVACVLAYKLGAKQIVMHGVDFRTHPHFKSHSLNKALLDFQELQKAMKKGGVELFVGNDYSELSRILPVFNPKETY